MADMNLEDKGEAVGGIAAALKAVADFEKQMDAVKPVLPLTVAELSQAVDNRG